MTKSEKAILYDCFRDIELRGENYEEYFDRILNLLADQFENEEKYDSLKNFLGGSGSHRDVVGSLGVFSYGFKKKFPKWASVVVELIAGVDVVVKKSEARVVHSDNFVSKRVRNNVRVILVK